jgi:hypothetical protein
MEHIVLRNRSHLVRSDGDNIHSMSIQPEHLNFVRGPLFIDVNDSPDVASGEVTLRNIRDKDDPIMFMDHWAPPVASRRLRGVARLTRFQVSTLTARVVFVQLESARRLQ